MENQQGHEMILYSKAFKIPIEEFEEDLDREVVKEKKKEILELFASSNNIHTKEEFKEIENYLHEACIKGDVELIKIYLSETIENDSKSLKFKIDKINHTASLFKVNNTNTCKFIVPRTVEYESTEYLITSISGINKKIKILKFNKNSAVETIYRYAFTYSSKINEIYFPTSLKELKEGWCIDTSYLSKIIISPSNGQFIMKDDKYLLGKSDSNKDEFDVLLFASRDIKEISIPSNVKVISPYAFQFCNNLSKVEIPPNSNLQTIESDAFSDVLIKEIYFPTSLNELKDEWCNRIRYLTKITISPSNGQFVIKDDKYLIGKSDSNKDEFDIIKFACRDIKEISIPSNIKVISPYAFQYCRNLTKVEIPSNSNLQTIGSNAFYETKIKEIKIPSKISKICEHAFQFCENLSKIEFDTNSNLQTIGKYAFCYTKIKEIIIPSNFLNLCRGVFYNCTKLSKIEFGANSNLQTIESNAFSSTHIKDFIIPSEVSQICEDAFYECFYLQIVEISEESKLDSFPLSAFNYTKHIIMIPPSLKKLIH